MKILNICSRPGKPGLLRVANYFCNIFLPAGLWFFLGISNLFDKIELGSETRRRFSKPFQLAL